MSQQAHIEWSVEIDGKCPDCGSEPVLVYARLWDVADADQERADEYGYPAEDDDVSGHYCCTCRRMVTIIVSPKERGSR